jgi:putative membrane protein
MRKLAIIMAGAAILAACSSSTPPEPPVVAVDPNNPLMAPGYLAMAASSDLFEVQSGQLAQQMSQNPGIRQFGGMLVTDHTNSTNILVAAAQAAGITPPPPMLLPKHQAMLDQLRAAGPNFDAAFRDAQIAAHTEALALHQNYAAQGDVAQLRTTAGQIVPVIQGHLQHAQALQLTPPPPPPTMQPVTTPGERG